MPMFCAVYGCSNRSNRETTRSFYRVPKVVVHRGEKSKQLTEKRRRKWLDNRLSNNARVCSDHFVNGRPSAVNDFESVDWAPTVLLGYQKGKPVSEVPRKREKMMMTMDHQHQDGARALLDHHWTNKNIKQEDDTDMLHGRQDDGTRALLDLHWSNENIKQEGDTDMLHGRQDAVCQTDLTMDDIERMKDALLQTSHLGTKAVDTQFGQEACQKNEEFYIGLPVVLVIKQEI